VTGRSCGFVLAAHITDHEISHVHPIFYRSLKGWPEDLALAVRG
jgi:hypothetical protein